MIADILIVGAGLAGLSAASRAAELGLSVCVLEAGDSDPYACNSRILCGLFHVTMDAMVRPQADIEASIARVTRKEGVPALASALGVRSRFAIDWQSEQPLFRPPCPDADHGGEDGGHTILQQCGSRARDGADCGHFRHRSGLSARGISHGRRHWSWLGVSGGHPCISTRSSPISIRMRLRFSHRLGVHTLPQETGELQQLLLQLAWFHLWQKAFETFLKRTFSPGEGPTGDT